MREQNGTMTKRLFQPLPRWGSRVITAFALIAVALGFWWGMSYYDRKLRVDFLENARMVSRAIDWRLIRELSAGEADLVSPAYRRIKEQMTGIHQASPNNRFVYLLKQRPDGTVIILVDSEPPSSKDYSPPGQEYQEVAPAIRQVFADNRESAVGPVTDRWGTWISALIPVVDPETGRTVALFGMDIDGRDWKKGLIQKTAESLALILVFIVPLAVYLMQRRRAEQELYDSEERYRILFNEALVGICMADAETGIIIDCNQGMADLTGRTIAELIGAHQTNLHPPQEGKPPYSPTFLRHKNEATGTVLPGQIITASGEIREVEIKALAFVFRDRQVILGTFNDVTERNRAETALRHSEEHLRRAEEMGHLGHWRLDLRTSIQTWSDEMYRIYGVTPEEFQPSYESIFQLVHPDDHETRARSYAAVRREGAGDFEYRVVRPDGEQRIISGTAKLQYDSSGEPEAMFGTILDITELRQKESELHQKNAEMERFTYTVSHDLRSPLVTIKTFLGFLEQDLAANDPERVTQDIAYINGAADKMRRLLDDLIEMSRVGRIVNTPTFFSFRELVEQALVIVAGQIATLGVDVTVHEAELSFFGDRLRLTEVWQNLLDNAVKYMGAQPKPRIEIGVSGEGRDSVFFVRDNGIGIAPEHGEKIFGLFEKLDNMSEGTGLGLTLVKRIVETNGGRIWVESDGTGHGSCFRFTLPEALQIKDLPEAAIFR